MTVNLLNQIRLPVTDRKRSALNRMCLTLSLIFLFRNPRFEPRINDLICKNIIMFAPQTHHTVIC